MIRPTDWGSIGAVIREESLYAILRMCGHNTIRCINRNGRTLGNAWMEQDRTDRAKAIMGSTKNWVAWRALCNMANRTMMRYADVPITVRGDSDVLIAMARAAYGRLVVCGTLDVLADGNNLYHQVIVFRNVVVLLQDILILDGDNIDQQDSVVHESEYLNLKPYYELGNIFDIRARSDTDSEEMVTRTIVELLYLCLEHKNGKPGDFSSFFMSLNSMLSATNTYPVLDSDSVTHLKRGWVPPELFTAYLQGMCSSYGNVRIDEPITQPDWTGVYSAVLWKDGPLFCVVNRGKSVFRTTDFPLENVTY
jgi:hypothetical protein